MIIETILLQQLLIIESRNSFSEVYRYHNYTAHENLISVEESIN